MTGRGLLGDSLEYLLDVSVELEYFTCDTVSVLEGLSLHHSTRRPPDREVP